MERTGRTTNVTARNKRFVLNLIERGGVKRRIHEIVPVGRKTRIHGKSDIRRSQSSRNIHLGRFGSVYLDQTIQLNVKRTVLCGR